MTTGSTESAAGTWTIIELSNTIAAVVEQLPAAGPWYARMRTLESRAQGQWCRPSTQTSGALFCASGFAKLRGRTPGIQERVLGTQPRPQMETHGYS